MIKNMLFLVLASLFMISCNKQAPLDQEISTLDEGQELLMTDIGIQTIGDFDALVKRERYPLNKLSKEALLSLKESMTFNEDQRLRSLNTALIEKELGEEDFKLLFEQLTGGPVFITDQLPTEKEMEKLSANAGGRWYSIILQNHRPVICFPCSRDCCTFSPHLTCVLQVC
ncbi:MAG: hypothetical protein AAFP19_04020 [Bacteroidota bacterium]